MTNGKQFLNDD